MFAYLASNDPRRAHHCDAVVRRLAEQCGTLVPKIRSLSIPNFRLTFFDTGNDLRVYKDERYLLLLSGTILNKEAIQVELGCSSENEAELIFRLYQRGKKHLSKLDGHLSFLLFDAATQKVTLMGDRFHRYSVVYLVAESTYVSSHSSLLYPFLDNKTLDMDAYSQSVHFRWLTGEKRLFTGIHQVLPGSLTHIDKQGDTRRDVYFRLAFQREENLDQDYWIQQTDTALDKTMSLIAKKHDVIGVPLSGGVDSSLMLAKAKEHFPECVAVTARFLDGENPELDNARYVAKKLGVRHIIADIDDNFVRDMFPELVRLHEQPPRNFSDIALAKTLQMLSTEVDAFLYGEAADTFFGLSCIHRILAANRKSTLFRQLPWFLQNLSAKLVPERSERFRRLKYILAGGIDALVYSVEKITYVTPPSQMYRCSKSPRADQELIKYLEHQRLPLGDRATIQMLSTGVMNHIENTGRLATYYGLQMYVPFTLNDPRSVAARLPLEMQNKNGVYKKVLRELACRYFDREFIYSEKFGFPTPTKQWLKGPLGERVQRSIQGTGAASRYYMADRLSTLSIDQDFAHFWFAICLDELILQANMQSDKVLVAA